MKFLYECSAVGDRIDICVLYKRQNGATHYIKHKNNNKKSNNRTLGTRLKYLLFTK